MPRTMRDKETRIRLGERLRNRRLQLGLTQDEAAERIGIKRDTYSRWEQGRNFPDIDHLRRAQEALGIELTDLAIEQAGVDSDQFGEILRPLEDAVQRVERQIESLQAELRTRRNGH
jgi:transcriptional regulator with XRE-family HTH domain